MNGSNHMTILKTYMLFGKLKALPHISMLLGDIYGMVVLLVILMKKRLIYILKMELIL